MAPNSYLSSIGTSPSLSIPRPENLCNGSQSRDRPAVLEYGAGLDRVQDPSRRFGSAGTFGGLDAVFTRRRPGTYRRPG
jgi:hypothetical protein